MNQFEFRLINFVPILHMNYMLGLHHQQTKRHQYLGHSIQPTKNVHIFIS